MPEQCNNVCLTNPVASVLSKCELELGHPGDHFKTLMKQDGITITRNWPNVQLAPLDLT